MQPPAPELVVFDSPQDCPYLEGRTARMPLRMPIRALDGSRLDAVLAEGDRRSGTFLYRTRCPECRACEPIRLAVADFRPSATHRRTIRRGDRALQASLGKPQVEPERVALYNRHKRLRGLSQSDEGAIDEESYRAFLVDTCCPSIELAWRIDGKLAAVAIADRGQKALSAVYCYYEPELTHLSLGTYAVLKQIELCRSWRLEYLYLGFYIAESSHMNYKGRFLPHERLIDGTWRRFEQIDL
jgi:arginyl-tRNA--protein-N-Asp/Glu arginylyltransferase